MINSLIPPLRAGVLALGLAACQINQPNPSPTSSASSTSPSTGPAVSPIGSSQPSPSVANTPSSLPVPPIEGLEAYYPFEGNALSQDRKHDGRLAQEVFFDMGIKGKSVSFPFGSPIDDVGIYLENGNEVSLGRTFSISVWTKTFSLQTPENSIPILCGSQGDHLGIGLFWSIGGIDIFLNKEQPDELWLHQEKSPHPEIQNEQWQHSVVTYDSEQLKIFLDGKLVQTKTFSRSTKNYGVIDSIGKCFLVLNDPVYQGLYRYQGYIDELRIYSRVLTNSEVQALYQFDKGGSS